jgi:hypothetical protein
MSISISIHALLRAVRPASVPVNVSWASGSPVWPSFNRSGAEMELAPAGDSQVMPSSAIAAIHNRGFWDQIAPSAVTETESLRFHAACPRDQTGSMSGLSFPQLPCPDDDHEDFSYREDLLAGSAGKSSGTGKSSGSWRGDTKGRYRKAAGRPPARAAGGMPQTPAVQLSSAAGSR